MPLVQIEPNLYERVEEAAQENKASVDEILAEAVRLYLWEQDRQKIDQESTLYRQQHSHLVATYLGQYIAMHEGKVIDSDQNFAKLQQRVRQHYKHTAVMITRVEEQPDRILTRRGFQQDSKGV
jgi:metal-responsive CopG/Arc/MetJ family transcriptional regulator